ncbi:hypothetical protein [Bradyrhizobium sp. S3.7.6]
MSFSAAVMLVLFASLLGFVNGSIDLGLKILFWGVVIVTIIKVIG